MKYVRLLTLFLFSGSLLSFAFTANAQNENSINLNGIWEFDQTLDAFPPATFTRTCVVPGLIHLAEPRIVAYDKFFKRPATSTLKDQYNLQDLDYTPRYSWYRKEITISKQFKDKEAIISINKSQYVTQVFVNGMDVGTSMECYTPIEFPVTQFLKFGEKNEILIRVGERIYLPSQAAGGTDKEKEHYLPGIWDDVSLKFSGKLRVHRALILPDVEKSEITVKTQIRSFYPAQLFYGTSMYDSCKMQIDIFRKDNQKKVGSKIIEGEAKRDNLTYFETELPITNPQLWSPDNSFLYTAQISIIEENKVSDKFTDDFGMRDFKIEGKHFYLNGEKIYLRGSNITLQRFFEDPDCSNLVWDRKWVTQLLGSIPKETHWNAMRICVGIVPDFWYDVADSCGLLLQNEWLYWQHHGWDDQIRKEYTDWVWSDGNHPSIVIWDAINENKQQFIGNTLIPELKQLDPTRVWDAGYMEAGDMQTDEMDEPHPYMCAYQLMNSQNVDTYMQENPYDLGKISNWSHRFSNIPHAKSAQLVNEYGWIWLWRDGSPAKLTKNHYDYFVGKNATPQQRWELQAYWLQLETEWLRAERSLAGVLAFCLLTNNYGYTGDYFTGNIKELNPTITLDWFKHCFSPVAVFIDMSDQRYFRHQAAHTPGTELMFNLVGVNDFSSEKSGDITIRLLNGEGREVYSQVSDIEIPAYGSHFKPVSITLPDEAGGYLLLSELMMPGSKEPVISRRYIRVGELAQYGFYNYNLSEKRD